MAPWHHIENLDLFFSRVYHLHQKNGFLCMLLSEMFELVQFVFVVTFTTFLVSCVDYDILFANKLVNNTHRENQLIKVTLPDAFLPPCVCTVQIRQNVLIIFILMIAGVFWVHRLVKFIYNICCYWEICAFYKNALKIPMAQLPYCSWQEVQARIIHIQKEHQICIHKRELSELDIYHRILRFKNYTVAMINKSLLPIRFHVPFLGEVVFYTRGLKYNFELIFLWGPGSLFQNEWSLKPEYKRAGNRLELAQKLSTRILWIGITNLLLCPIILIWQILYAFFSYTEVIKREPGSLGARCWSLYGRCYLRHFNELDHELQSRLSKGYKAASKYMNCFLSPLLSVLAKNLAFFAGSILAVLITLTVYDEDVLAVEHVLTTITLLGLCITVCSNKIDKAELSGLVYFDSQKVFDEVPPQEDGVPSRQGPGSEMPMRISPGPPSMPTPGLFPVPEAGASPTAGRHSTINNRKQWRSGAVLTSSSGAEMMLRSADPLALRLRQTDRLPRPSPYCACAVPVTSPAVCNCVSVRVRNVGCPPLHALRVRVAGTAMPRMRSLFESPGLGVGLGLRLVTYTEAPPGPGLPGTCLIHRNPLSGSRGPILCVAIVSWAVLQLLPLPHIHRLGLWYWASQLLSDSSLHFSVAGSPDMKMMSSGSSAWEGQLQSMVLSEYASTEMSLHALYMHELHKQQMQGEPSRHVWHRQDSDDSGESGVEEAELRRPSPMTIPRSSTYPVAASRTSDLREEPTGLLHTVHRRYGGISSSTEPQRPFSQQPMGGWTESSPPQHPEPVPEEGLEDELPPQMHQV
ncbi:autophagy-related protein 9A-like [Rhincodon typus]|uniref:autophagy-related protein 9A-like n=1 Tax=Rhincodon typus TaxID=259920 RepID=UPI00202FB4E7|nr:autophagy-related protein 9A-like [Rhincodon typus]